MAATFYREKWTTFTVTAASPAVFSATAHNLVEGDVIILETTGALLTGLSVDIPYIVIRDKMTDDAFLLSSGGGASQSGVISNYGHLTPINTSGTQSGTHTFLKLNSPRLVPVFQNNK